jgi:hypothetical protein
MNEAHRLQNGRIGHHTERISSEWDFNSLDCVRVIRHWSHAAANVSDEVQNRHKLRLRFILLHPYASWKNIIHNRFPYCR